MFVLSTVACRGALGLQAPRLVPGLFSEAEAGEDVFNNVFFYGVSGY